MTPQPVNTPTPRGEFAHVVVIENDDDPCALDLLPLASFRIRCQSSLRICSASTMGS